MANKYLLDYNNPDAGIGHSLGIINRALKIAQRNNLQLTYSDSQLAKSHAYSFKWKVSQFLRIMRGRKAYETHNIGNDLNFLLNLKDRLESRELIENKIKRGEIKLVTLPDFNIENPSINQNDDLVYKTIDQFIQSYPGSNIAFKISKNFSGDSEYGTTRDWFLESYYSARKKFPIGLEFDMSKINIAIHIRRGDLLPGRQFSDLSTRMLPDSWYKKILDSVLKNTSEKISIHIFSEGVNGQYRTENGTPFSWKTEFSNKGFETHEHIDSNFLHTFHHLIQASVLIGSKSGMSHLAGMLSNQVKIMPKMWHSYKGTNHILEVSDKEEEIEQEAIVKHIKAALTPY
jgi:hypothetical protein